MLGGVVQTFVGDWAEAADGGVAPVRVVPGLDPLEDRRCKLLAGLPLPAVTMPPLNSQGGLATKNTPAARMWGDSLSPLRLHHLP
jgi:hypothetical protein